MPPTPQVKHCGHSYGVAVGRLGCARAAAPNLILAGPPTDASVARRHWWWSRTGGRIGAAYLTAAYGRGWLRIGYAACTFFDDGHRPARATLRTCCRWRGITWPSVKLVDLDPHPAPTPLNNTVSISETRLPYLTRTARSRGGTRRGHISLQKLAPRACPARCSKPRAHACAGPLPFNRDSGGGPCGVLQTTVPLAPADTPLPARAYRPIVRRMSRA